MRKRWFILFLLLPLVVQAEETPRSAMHKGLKAYKAGDYTNAVSFLKKTVLEFPGIGNYNLGNAYYRLKEYEKAAQTFNEVLRSPDLALQAKAYYNRANALFSQATNITDIKQSNRAIEFAFQAEDSYEKSLLLNPHDLDAKQNFERARNLRMQLEFKKGKWYYDQADALLKKYKAKKAKQLYLLSKKEFTHLLKDLDPSYTSAKDYIKNIDQKLAMLQKSVEDARANLDKSLLFIKDYQYALAARALTQLPPEFRYAFDLEPELKKKYEEIIKKDSQVLKIIKDLSKKNLSK